MVVEAQVVLNHHIFAIVVDMGSMGIVLSKGVHEPVSLDEYVLAGPRPDTTASVVHPWIDIGTGIVSNVTADQEALTSSRHHARTTDFLQVVVEDLNVFQVDVTCLLRMSSKYANARVSRPGDIAALDYHILDFGRAVAHEHADTQAHVGSRVLTILFDAFRGKDVMDIKVA